MVRSTMRTMAAIEIEHLHKSYGDVVAVDDVSLSVEPGEIFGIIGVNGAGKTTTVECVSGLTRPDRGRIEVLGLDPTHERDEIRRRVGVQLQESSLPDRITVTEALTLHAAFYENPAEPARADRAARAHAPARRPLRQALRRREAEAQRRARARGPPAAGDPRRAHDGPGPARAARDLGADRGLREQGLTVLLVTHFMDEVERLCDRVAVIHAGRVKAARDPGGDQRRRGPRGRLRGADGMILRTEFKLVLREPVGAIFSLGPSARAAAGLRRPGRTPASRTRTSTARCRSTP